MLHIKFGNVYDLTVMKLGTWKNQQNHGPARKNGPDERFIFLGFLISHFFFWLKMGRVTKQYTSENQNHLFLLGLGVTASDGNPKAAVA